MDNFADIQNIINAHYNVSDTLSKEELNKRLFIFYEELMFQNEELKRVNEQILEMKNEYQELFDFAPVSYFIINDKGIILDANKNAKNLFGNVLGQSILRYIDFKSKKDLYEFLKKLIVTNYSRVSTIFKIAEARLHMEIISKRIESKKNQFLIACIDFEKQYKTIEEIHNISYKDHLTGLYNRRFFEKTVAEMNFEKNLPLSFVFADANGLKIVNDSLGHLKGDEFLKKAGKIIYEKFHEYGSVARVGGDEFVVILSCVDSQKCNELVELCEKKCNAIKVNDIGFSVSFGGATMESSLDDVYDIIFKAENAMYRKKLLNEAANSKRIIRSIRKSLYEKYPIEKEKSEQVNYYIVGFGKYLGMSESEIEFLSLAALHYNIGKISYDNGKIDDVSINYEDHVEIAYRILKNITNFSRVAYIILCSNEYVNGKGVPNNLTGDVIPIESKILAVCKKFVMLTLNNSNNLVFSKEDALAHIESEINIKYDAEIVEKFVDFINTMHCNKRTY